MKWVKVTIALLAILIVLVLLPQLAKSAERTDFIDIGQSVPPTEGIDVVQENRTVNDVAGAFENLARSGEWMGFYIGPIDPQIELFPRPFNHHIQGMARSPRIDGPPIFYFAVSGNPYDDDDDSFPALMVVKMASLPTNGERLGSNRLKRDTGNSNGETVNTAPTEGDEVIKIFKYGADEPYWHPAGIAMVGDILAVPLGGRNQTGEGSGIKVIFYDCRDPEDPQRLDYELVIKANVGDPDPPAWSHGAQGLAITKLPDGHFLLVTNTKDYMHFHWSNQGSFFKADGITEDPGFAFTEYQEISIDDLNAAGYWPKASSPQNLTFVQETNGPLYLLGSQNDEKDTTPVWKGCAMVVGVEVCDWFSLGNDQIFLIKVNNPSLGCRQGASCTISLEGAGKVRKTGRSAGNKPGRDEGHSYSFREWNEDNDVWLKKYVAKRDQANFIAGATAYVSPSGELLYYGVSHWADGNPTDPGEQREQWFEGDFAKMGEFSHKYMTSAETCGQPLFRLDNLGGPFTIPEGSDPVTLSAENYMVEPWVRMYQNYYDDEDGDWGLDPGITVTMDWRNQWTGSSTTTKNPVDDYDRFTKLDGWRGECHGNDYGFSNCVSSYAWCGPTNAHLVFYDAQEYASDGNRANQYDTGAGSAVDQSFKNHDFNDEAGSVEILWCKTEAFEEHHGDDERPRCPGGEWYPWNIDSAYVWTKDGKGELKPADSPDRRLFYPGSGGSMTTVTMTFMGEHEVSATIEVINVLPTVSALDLSDPPYSEGYEITVGGEWSDPGAPQVDVTIEWGDGMTEVMISEHEDGQTGPFSALFSFSHVYADNGSYSIRVCADDGEPIPDGVDPPCKEKQITVDNVAPTVEAGSDQVIYEGDILTLDPATFSDKGFDCLDCNPQTVENFSGTIDWGDGITDTIPFGSLPETPGSEGVETTGSVPASHQYLVSPGIYPVTVCVSDDDGAETCDSLNVTVVHGFFQYCMSASKHGDDLNLEENAYADCSIRGEGKVELKKGAEVGGDVIAVDKEAKIGEGASVGRSVTSGDKVKIKKESSVVYDVTSGDDVKVEKDAYVGGDIYAAGQVTVESGATVGGVIFQNYDVSPILDVTYVDFDVSASGSEVTVRKNTTESLEPGEYGILTVQEGATLTLSAGSYSFYKVNIHKDATLQIDLNGGDLVIDVEKKVDFKEGVKMTVFGGDASNILFRIAGSEVKLGKNGVFLGTFLAPNAHIDVHEGAVVTGALHAEKIQMKKDTMIHSYPALELFIELFMK